MFGLDHLEVFLQLFESGTGVGAYLARGVELPGRGISQGPLLRQDGLPEVVFLQEQPLLLFCVGGVLQAIGSGPLEEHVLDHMSDPAGTGRVVGTPGLERDAGGKDRRVVALHKHDGKPVGQHLLLDGHPELSRQGGGGKGQGQGQRKASGQQGDSSWGLIFLA